MIRYIASCSCGKDSVAMVLTLIEKEYPLDCVVFLDTGKEFQAIYKVWDQLAKILDKHCIRHVRLKPYNTFDYYFSEHEVNTRSGESKIGYSCCGGRSRWMTTMKTMQISNFYKTNYPNDTICEYIGLASDELDRVKIKRENTVKIYPLILWGMTENDALVKAFKYGIEWLEPNGTNLYQVLDRVSCYCCGNKNLKELKAIYQYLPEYWQKLKEMQDKTSIPFRDHESIYDLEKRFGNEVREVNKLSN